MRPTDFIEPCLPTVSRTVPTGTGWAYEIKRDGFRFICCRDGDRVRLLSRGGHDWSAQLPAIVKAILAFPVTSVTLDGEVVICGADGVSQFDRMPTVFGRRGSRAVPQVAAYSITSSTCASKIGESDSPNACAVFLLTVT